MKKYYVYVVIILILVTGIAAVTAFFLGDKKRKSDETVSLLSPDLEHPLADHFDERYTDDLAGIIKRRYIRVLTTLNMTNYFLQKGEQYGFEYSLLRDYEKFLNRGIKKGLKVVLEFKPVSRDMLIPALIEGYGDIAAAGLTITPQRQELVDFTEPYLTGVEEVIVTHTDTDRPERLEELAGRELFIRQSSSYYESIMELNERLKDQGMKPVRVIEASETLETEDILEMVHSGAIKMTASDNHIARIWAKVLNNVTVNEHLAIRKGGEIAWMVRKENPKLRASLNAFIRERKKGTRIGNIYFKRYFQDNIWISNPLAKGKRENHQRYERLFRKYADTYGFDWKLIMALAYQESRLDHKKKSRAGAVGIMQVRPMTARDKQVNIENVYRLENNIHAGVKYLSFLREGYFNEEGLLEQDKIRFALAAYNAGPRKIKRARSLAQQMGFDPKRWFRNVEIATLKLVGQEPVRYVSNINKYYIIYSIDAERSKG